jgi:hypothetical protein
VTRFIRIAVGLVVLATAGPAVSHQETPEIIVADLGSAKAREASGIVRVVRDTTQPRLLVVRVGDAWWKLPAEVRRDRASEWGTRWRHAVPQGIVAVVDAKTEQPVVRFGPRGEVVGIAPAPGAR